MKREKFLYVALLQATEEGVGISLAKFADMCIEWGQQHPHWISVEDELPPRWETNPNVSVQVITCKYVDRELQDIDMQRYIFGDGKWQYGDATHWMPFQFPEKGGEK